MHSDAIWYDMSTSRGSFESNVSKWCILTLFDPIFWLEKKSLKTKQLYGAFWHLCSTTFSHQTPVSTSITPFNLYCNFRRLIISNKNVLQHVSKFCNGEYGHLSTNVDDIYLLTKFRIFETFLLLNVIILSSKDVKTIRFV